MFFFFILCFEYYPFFWHFFLCCIVVWISASFLSTASKGSGLKRYCDLGSPRRNRDFSGLPPYCTLPLEGRHRLTVGPPSQHAALACCLDPLAVPIASMARPFFLPSFLGNCLGAPDTRTRFSRLGIAFRQVFRWLQVLRAS